jgi:hypothetical protein
LFERASRPRETLISTSPTASDITVCDPATVPHVHRFPTWLGLVLRMTEVIDYLLVQRGLHTFLVNSFNRPPGPANANHRALVSATIVAAAVCSGDN